MADDRNPVENPPPATSAIGLSTQKPFPEGEGWVRGKYKAEGVNIELPLGLRLTYAFVPLLVLLVATFLACILAYLMVTLWPDGPSFRTVIKKSSQLFLVLSIFPAMHYLKLNNYDLGFAPKPLFFKQLLLGAGLGFITLAPVFAALYLLDVTVIDKTQPWTWPWLSKKLIVELLLAVLISLFEEPLFRGVLFAGLSRKLSVGAAIFISAFYYAGLHFLDNKTTIPSQELNLFSGFYLLGAAFVNLLNPEILSAFLALFMVGVFLGVLRTQVNASLGVCIGCHACWVWLIKLSKTLFDSNPNSDYLFLINGHEGVIGPLVTVWLGLAIAGYFIRQRIIRASHSSIG